MNVLVVYCPSEIPLRVAIADHLHAVVRNTTARCFYFNAACRELPDYLARIPFDLIIYHTSFLSQRWSPTRFAMLADRVRPLIANGATTVALPQDEFIYTGQLCGFLNQFAIDHVLTVMPQEEWGAVYRRLERRAERLGATLTGYLEDRTLVTIADLQREERPRHIDVGYRAYRAKAWLGRHGMLKTTIADRFVERGPAAGLSLDISTAANATIVGDDWFRFLVRCRWTIGVEGGSGLLDEEGRIMREVEEHLRRRPLAPFAEIEAACFPGEDGRHRLVAISPRHLEACATRTAQVLIEGTYNGILVPGRHYLPLKADFSDLGEVMTAMRDEGLRNRLTEAAFTDVVASGRYGYRAFAQQLLGLARQQDRAGAGGDIAALHDRATEEDQSSWEATRVELIRQANWGPFKARLRRYLPDSFVGAIRRVCRPRA